MTLTKRIQYLLFFCLSLSLISCVNFEDVQITDIKSIEILEAGKSSLTLKSEIKISNPNYFSIEVTDSFFDVYIKNQKIGTASIDSDLKLSSNSEEYQSVTLVSTYDESQTDALSSVMGAILFGNREIEFKVDGFVEGKALFVKRKIDLVHSGKVPLSLMKN